MKKIRYSATFEDGQTIERSSHNRYGCAWRVRYRLNEDEVREKFGFSLNRETANPFRPSYYAGRALSSNERAYAKKKTQEFLRTSGYSVEFAEVVILGGDK